LTLALFDLDNTLLNGDSDHSWGMYLADIGVVDAGAQAERQDYFYQQYLNGTLDIYEFCEFQFQVLKNNSVEQLQQWRNDFLNDVVQPMINSGKPELVEQHRELGHSLVIITATNDFITRPIADRLGVETLLATTAEFSNGRYTGKVAGTPCFQDGKVTRLREWLEENDQSLAGSFFYSDSINDLPLLEEVAKPVAVTPDDRLRVHANDLHWQIID